MIHDCTNEDDKENAEDDALWQEFMRSVKPLDNARNVVTPTPPKVKQFLPDRQDDSLSLIRQVTPSPLPQKQIKKLRTQRIAIEASLDLHGYRIEAAHKAVEQFIHQALRQQIRCLEIITGRGNAARGTGQLRMMLPQWLQESSLQQLILHVEPNPATHGGSFLILLRRNKNNS